MLASRAGVQAEVGFLHDIVDDEYDLVAVIQADVGRAAQLVERWPCKRRRPRARRVSPAAPRVPMARKRPGATPFTELVSVEHPIALAPMGGSAGGALAAAVSNGGGLGLLGGAYGSRGWIERELVILRERTDRPWGIGFLAWAIDFDVIAWVLDQRPHAIMLAFGDPEPFAARVRDAGVPLIIQVTDLEEAQRAVDVGADVIVARGGEAGGHGGRRATLPFVPVVVDLAAPAPVLAAGGIADGRGLAAALALGAAGALIGTRFQASHEAVVPAEVRKAIIDGYGVDERHRDPTLPGHHTLDGA